jgi:DNA-binding MarR family transcriptional regulator
LGAFEGGLQCLVQNTTPLSPAEEAFWRAFVRMTVALPRTLESDHIHATGLALHEYGALVMLSEAPNRELRMSDLATALALSASRITRLVDEMQSRGLLMKRRSADDARGNIAALTPHGLARLEAAYPAHLLIVRQRVMDYIDQESLDAMTRAIQKVLAAIDDCSPPRLLPTGTPLDGIRRARISC